MHLESLLTKKHDVYSQNGEDGIIETIFQRIGLGSKTCCEFGAWDGVVLSNCRKLILEGWRAVMIEGDAGRFQSLLRTYASNPQVICVNRFVDTGANSVDTILSERGIASLDFLSIDIDGLDYDLFADLKMRPRVVCVEVNAGLHPTRSGLIPKPIAQHGVGQPLLAFTQLAEKKGYRLVCYNANAFFIQEEIVREFSLPVVSPQEAYEDYLKYLDPPAREWMYLVNLGLNPPFYRHGNSYLGRRSLGIALPRAVLLKLSKQPRKFKRMAKNCCKWIIRRRAV